MLLSKAGSKGDLNRKDLQSYTSPLSYTHPHLASDVLVDEVVLVLVVDDHVNLLGARSTDVRTWRENTAII